MKSKTIIKLFESKFEEIFEFLDEDEKGHLKVAQMS